MPLLSKKGNWLADIALILCLLIVMFAPLAIGAVHGVVVVGFAALAGLALVLHVVARLVRQKHVWVSLWVLPIFLGLMFTAFHLLPLPHFLRSVLAPSATETQVFVTAALTPRALSQVLPVLSQDPPATALALLRLFVALVVFCVVACRARSRRTRLFLARAMAVAAFLLLLVTALHTVLRLDSMYGLFLSTRKLTITIAPLVNPNHLARAFGAFAVFLLARSLTVRSKKERALNVALGLSCAIMLFLCGSHGAVLALTATLLALFIFGRQNAHTKNETKNEGFSKRTLILVLAGTAVVALCLVFFRELAAQLMSEGSTFRSTSKLSLYAPSFRLAVENALLGTGNSAFQAALPQTLSLGELWQNRTMSHPENIILQTLCDHGVFFGSALILLALALGLPLLAELIKGRSPPLEILVVVFFVMGDLFDFSLETGFGLWLCTFAWAISAARVSVRKKSKQRRVIRLGAIPSTLLTLVLILLASVSAYWVIDGDRFAQQKAIEVYDANREAPKNKDDVYAKDPALFALMEDALASHPNDGHFAYYLASYARQVRDVESALKWANRAMLLWPNHPGPHLEAARALASLGHKDQALLEYRFSWQAGQENLMKEIALRFSKPEDRVRALPENDARAFNEHCKQLRREKRIELALACLDTLSSFEGAPKDTRVRAVDLSIRLKDAPAARTRLIALAPTPSSSSEHAILWARVVELESGAAQALQQSGQWFESKRMATSLMEWRTMSALRLKDYSEASRMMGLIKHRSMNSQTRARIEGLEAVLLTGTGKKAAALRLLRSITRKRPRDLLSLKRLALLEKELALTRDLEKTITKIRALKPGDPILQTLSAP